MSADVGSRLDLVGSPAVLLEKDAKTPEITPWHHDMPYMPIGLAADVAIWPDQAGVKTGPIVARAPRTAVVLFSHRASGMAPGERSTKSMWGCAVSALESADCGAIGCIVEIRRNTSTVRLVPG